MPLRIYERRYTEPRMTRQGNHGPFVLQTNVWARNAHGWSLESVATVAITLADGRKYLLISSPPPREA
jgi:hypothetical protein